MPASHFIHSEFRMLRFKWCVLTPFLCIFLLLVASHAWSEFQAPLCSGVQKVSACVQVPWLGFLSVFYEQPFGYLFNVLSLTWQNSLMPSFLFTIHTLMASSSLSLASSLAHVTLFIQVALCSSTLSGLFPPMKLQDITVTMGPLSHVLCCNVLMYCVVWNPENDNQNFFSTSRMDWISVLCQTMTVWY